MNDEPERETVLFTVCLEVPQAAIAQVASCEACNPNAAAEPQLINMLGGRESGCAHLQAGYPM